MEKIRLKFWQKATLGGLLLVLVILLTLSVWPVGSDEKTIIPVASEMNINIKPADTTNRVFYEGLSKGDSVRFEQIGGAAEGWIFEIFLAAQEADYQLMIDFRESGHVWKKGQHFIFTAEIPEMKENAPLGLMQMKLQSGIKIAENSTLSDRIVFSRYYIALSCIRYDSLASFNGSFYGDESLSNPEFSDESMIVSGWFRAHNIPIGRRQVN